MIQQDILISIFPKQFLIQSMKTTSTPLSKFLQKFSRWCQRCVRYPLLAIILLGVSCRETVKSEFAAADRADRPPNIVIIFTDDQGYSDVGVYGARDIPTPNLDAMAADGLLLTNFYAAQPVCSASRAGLLTGCYPNRVGIHNALMPNSPVGLNPAEETLAELLRQQGYRTGIFGKWHLGDHPDFLPTRHGFDEFFGIPYSNDMWPLHPLQGPVFDFGPLPLYEQERVVDTLEDQRLLTRQITERSVDFINRHKEEPFFLYVPHPQPHVPLFVSDAFRGKSGRGLYGDVIMEIDWSVGQVLGALEDNGLTDDTWVIFTSDNGPWLAYGNHSGRAEPLREGKGTNWEGGVREPCIMKFPGRLPRGKVLDEPLMAIDLLPTIASVTGSPQPGREIDGKNAWGLLSGAEARGPQDAYYFYYRVNELQAVRDGDWKLVLPHNYRTMQGQEPGADGLPGAYDYVDVTAPELYNLREDPGETNNLAERHPEVLAAISRKADSMRRRLGDALTGVKGVENRPPGRVETGAGQEH
ncbi:arylsulfatase A (precursor) [Robiginitalea biformata HTCC2501]|uniref:Arylsulfatase A (Precursor) n=2 Tax=Flavobacteriaceae TaxID=49546 RepID=A4CGL5_ROBBH|nr:arylsulfatase A (precursor) [Robiginitalea biformata HTCC2501]